MKAVTYRDAGVRVLVNQGMCKGSKGITTGDTKPGIEGPLDGTGLGVTLVGVQLARKFKFIREDFLEPEPFRAVLPSSGEKP